MSYSNVFYLHFVTDLQRAIACIMSKNTIGAEEFLKHANKIYEEKLKQVMDGQRKELAFDELWIDIYHHSLPRLATEQEKYCEKLLTLSSMIFLRSTKVMPVLPHSSVIAEKTQAVVSV